MAEFTGDFCCNTLNWAERNQCVAHILFVSDVMFTADVSNLDAALAAYAYAASHFLSPPHETISSRSTSITFNLNRAIHSRCLSRGSCVT